VDSTQPVSKQRALEDAIEHFDGDEMAADTFLQKYAVQLPQDKVSEEGNSFLETSPEDMWERMAKQGASVEDNPGKWEEKFYNAFTDWKVVPQGSIMFALGNPHQKSSSSNCFVIPIKDDSIEGLFDTAKEIARTYSYRGGVGTDISILRPKGSVVHNCSRTSTGAVSFMDFYSYITNLIGQNGRRGALMLTISDSHPDLYHPEADGMDFINIKRDLDKVTGANISVRISDAFMEAVENGEEWTLSWERKDNKVYVGDEFIKESEGPDIRIERSYPAQDIWDNIVESATESAEPGVMFWDRIKEQSPADQYSDQGYETVSSNPCCFSKQDKVEVLTKVGIKNLQEIDRGDEVWVDSEQDWFKSKGYFEQGKAEVYRVEFSNGEVFRLTKNHKLEKRTLHLDNVRVEKELVKLENLEVGDAISLNNSKPKSEAYSEFSDWMFNNEKPHTNITSIEEAGVHEVGCIEVKDQHKFTANGIISGNSEIPLSEYGACTLLSMNLTEFVKDPFTENARINGRKLHSHIETATRFLDNVKSIDAEKVPLEQQKERALEARRIGIGTHGLGDMLAMLGLEYDSDEAIEQCDKLYEFIKNKVYQSSAKLANEKGTFPIYDEDKHFQSPFIQRLNSKTKSMIEENGLRNIACLTLAPTGTVSMLSQTSSGIEPIFRLQYERNVRNGGNVETYEVNHHLVDDYLDSHPETNGVEDLPDCFQTVKDIDYVKRTELQGVIQKHIDHAISNTINIPADEENLHEIVSNSYKQAWRNGCKGYTVYVDGSREEAPLQSGEQEPEQVSDNLEYKADTKVWEAKDDYGHYFITEGLDQVFVNGYSSTAGRLNPDTIELADNMESVLKAHVDDERVDKYVERAGFDSIEKVARLTSLALKTNNADKVKVFFEQFSDRTSLATRLNEIFEYRKIEQTEVCQECHSDNLKHQESCVQCLDCGWEKCGL
jgi:ribonucleotide reductase alpha subunit